MDFEENYQLKCLKETLVEILVQIDEVCRKHNLKYVIVGGTLLGAIRHKGFIPWDDDLDIAMPRSDYKKFIEISKECLPNDLHFRCFENDKNYYLPFGKVCKKGTTYITELDSDQTQDNEIFVDIFPLDIAEYPESLTLKFRNAIVKGLKAVVIRKKKMNIEKTSISVKFLQTLLFFCSTDMLMTIQKMAMDYKCKNGEYYTNLGSNYNYKKQTMPLDTYFPSRRITFENKEFQAPNKYEYYLNRIYGSNYMELPPIEKRVTHKIVKLKI